RARSLRRQDAGMARTDARSLGRLPFRRPPELFTKLISAGGQAMRQTRREVMALISVAMAGTTLGGVSFAQGAPKRGGILRISAPANPSSLDPATGGAGSDHAFLFTMYDTLTEWEFDTLKPKPG